jgi:hypothetical protein
MRSGLTYLQQTVTGAGYGSPYQEDVTICISANDFQPLHRYAFMTHVPCHLLAFQHTPRIGARSNRARGAVTVGLTVCLGATAEMVSLDTAGKSPPFGSTADIHGITRLKEADIDPMPQLNISGIRNSELSKVLE